MQIKCSVCQINICSNVIHLRGCNAALTEVISTSRNNFFYCNLPSADAFLGLDQNTVEKSVMAIHRADLLIVAGTSLTVYPAAGLINYYRGNRLVLINRDATSYDGQADLVLHESLGKVFEKL